MVATPGRRLGRYHLVEPIDGLTQTRVAAYLRWATTVAYNNRARMLAAVTKLKGEVEIVAPGSLPNDGKAIADDRTYT